jgi:hypothetical protein
VIPTPTADLSRVVAFASGQSRMHMQFKSKVVSEIHPSENSGARVVLTLGRMMFQFPQARNGEGLESRVFTCILL